MAQQLSEVEVLVEELETRVERLRALYEMYFMGIEKIEPAVARKDVDRRFYVLRRTQLRNTALRFRFLNVLLRYNTYQTYWMRISRKIEEGTYKRDVRRANARFTGPGPTKKRIADQEIEVNDDDFDEAQDTVPPARPTDDAVAALSARGSELEDELSLDVDLADDFGADSAWLEDQKVRSVLRPALVPKEAREATPPARANRPRDAMSTQPEIWIRPPAVKRPSSRPAPRSSGQSRPPRPRGTPAPRPEVGSAPVPNAAPGPAPRAGVRYAQGPQPRRASEMPPAPKAVPAPRQTSRPAAPLPQPPRKKSRPSMPRVEADKAPPMPGARPAPRPAQATSKTSKDSLSDERVRQIYTKYVETKRSLKESTAALTYESLAKSLRDSSDKLRSKHSGKSVDFEVAVKDGKTILRPVVK